MIRFIGDIHGNEKPYFQIVKDVQQSVQIGDYGAGFNSDWDIKMSEWQTKNPSHKFIRGNHDDPKVCNSMPNYLSDWVYDDNNKIMYIGGAWSLDYGLRIEHETWWPDEELSQEEFDAVQRAYIYYKPQIVVSHDAPLNIPKFMKLCEGLEVPTRTAVRFRQMFRYHQPKLWLFGHWHADKELTFDGTLFKCININHYVDVDVEKCEIINQGFVK